MNELDIVILVFIAIGALVGLFRGFFKEIVGTIGILVAAIVANFVSPYTIPYFGGWIGNENIAAIVVWAIVFVLAMFLMSKVAYLLSRILKAAQLGWLNRLAGGAFAAIKYCLIAALVISLLEIICSHVEGLKITDYLHGSQVVPMLHDAVDIIMPWCSEHILTPALEMLKK